MKLALLGCGLLGGSTASAWRRQGRVQEVVGFDTDARCSGRARALGIVDSVAPDLVSAAQGADCVLLATPVGAIDSVLRALAAHLGPRTIVTDVGSTKAGIVASARAALAGASARFVPAHPIAGGALPGIEHARPDLFEGRWVITTPDTSTDPQALGAIEANWSACGARVERMDAQEHDRIFASVSHLPHLLAFALVDFVAGQSDGSRKLQFAGAGFRDFSRIAASDPVMWRDIALANRAALLEQLRGFHGALDEVARAVEQGDAAALERIFARASQARRAQEFELRSHDE